MKDYECVYCGFSWDYEDFEDPAWANGEQCPECDEWLLGGDDSDIDLMDMDDLYGDDGFSTDEYLQKLKDDDTI